MKKITNTIYAVVASFCLLLTLSSCTDFLDEKSEKNLVVASSAQDLRALLDNPNMMNSFLMGLGEACADNYYLTDDIFNGLSEANRNIYTWGSEIFFNESLSMWLNHYRAIYYANVVLEVLEKNTVIDDSIEGKDIKGTALFFRAFHYSKLVGLFSLAYDENTARTDMGIPLRTTTDFNVPSYRSSVEESYEFVLKDINEAIALLQESTAHVYRPSKQAALALKSRVLLFMGKYNDAAEAARLALQIKDNLMDYNTLNVNTAFPFAPFNEEVIFHASGQPVNLGDARARMDTVLLESYESADLRLYAYFLKNADGVSYRFKGSYFGSRGRFIGLATDELYLTYAECLARTGETPKAVEWLDKLLINRYRTVDFIPTTITDSDELLDVILEQRRKGLVMRDVRWDDIKRLNREGRNITLKRHVNGEHIELKPNDARYALPLPQEIIDLTDMEQNSRQ